MVSAYSAKSIECHGYNIVRILDGRKKDVNVVINKESHIIVIPHIVKDNFKIYSKIYPVEIKNKTAIFYKAVHKNKDSEYYSDYSNSFTYKIGETKEEECADNKSGSCSRGIHIAHKSWAISFGSSWDNMALLECEVDIKDIVVCKDTDGKVRASKIKVIREIPKEEYYDFK